MKLDPRTFLSDVIEAGQAIHQSIAGISLDEYGNLPALVDQCRQLLDRLDREHP
ncbi:MAG: hypothetical protein ACKN89_01485 [Cyanobium sp.]|jgi:hypothetical protein